MCDELAQTFDANGSNLYVGCTYWSVYCRKYAFKRGHCHSHNIWTSWILDGNSHYRQIWHVLDLYIPQIHLIGIMDVKYHWCMFRRSTVLSMILHNIVLSFSRPNCNISGNIYLWKPNLNPWKPNFCFLIFWVDQSESRKKPTLIRFSRAGFPKKWLPEARTYHTLNYWRGVKQTKMHTSASMLHWW